jgi:hypothetical protein
MLYEDMFPLMSNLPGIGSPTIQNLAGFPSGLSGNVLPIQNASARFGPDPFFVPILSPVARAVEQAQQSQSNVAAAVEAPFNFFQTQAGQITKRIGWSIFAYGLVLIGVAALLWRPVLAPATRAGVKAVAKV